MFRVTDPQKVASFPDHSDRPPDLQTDQETPPQDLTPKNIPNTPRYKL